jgi:hypothetical protein
MPRARRGACAARNLFGAVPKTKSGAAKRWFQRASSGSDMREF